MASIESKKRFSIAADLQKSVAQFVPLVLGFFSCSDDALKKFCFLLIAVRFKYSLDEVLLCLKRF